MHADYVFVEGEVVTVNPEDEVAQAVAVPDGEICAVGTMDEAARAVSPRGAEGSGAHTGLPGGEVSTKLAAWVLP